MENCLFCRIEKGEIPSEKVYDGNTLFAIKDLHPQAPVHLLIIPKKHVATLWDVKEDDRDWMSEAFSVANRLANENDLGAAGYRLVLNCGAEAGQSVFHIHYHLLGGRALRWPPG